jgi:ABC-type nitrate/sulfonate/bicarbonate transport system permease component
MTASPSEEKAGSAPAPPPPEHPAPGLRLQEGWFALRRPIPLWQSLLLGGLCLALVLAVWWFVTRSSDGSYEGRMIGPLVLPSPGETISRVPDVWSSGEGEWTLVGNALTTIVRVAIGFTLAVAIGVPLGVAAGCFARINAFLLPIIIFGRNIPVAALIPIMLLLPGGETQKIAFIFVACVCFIISDTSQAIANVSERYVDTALTLGANRWQTIIKVLFPLALPSIFNSGRLLFGLAFGYIMLVESIKYASDKYGGLGFLINVFQRRAEKGGIYVILLVIPAIALVLDLCLLWVQRKLFPYLYGGDGILHYLVRGVLHAWDDLKRSIQHADWPPKTEVKK